MASALSRPKMRRKGRSSGGSTRPTTSSFRVSRVGSLPEAFRHYLETYAYLAQEIPDSYVLSCDHAKFLNHSPEPNTALRPFETLARVPIRAGDEITCDYRAFVAGWDGFEPKTA